MNVSKVWKIFLTWFRMKCEESEEEAESKGTEKFYQLSCFIEKGIVRIYIIRIS